jgi:NAD(P)-dependent dehydrogenase (short-subunit alcohol dehydrogenase family)
MRSMARNARTKTGIYRGGRDDAPISPKARVVAVHDASRPMGRAIALHLADRGQVVLACGSDPATLQDLPRETALGGLIEVSTAPTGQRKDRAFELFGRLDACVAVAEAEGPAIWGPFEQRDPSSALATGLFGPTLFASEMASGLPTEAERRGRLILVNTLPGLPFGSATAAARAGLEGLYEALHIELAVLGLHVILVAAELIIAPPPAPTPTETLVRALGALRDGAPRKLLAPPLKALLSRAASHAQIAALVEEALMDPKPKGRYLARVGGRLMGARANRALVKTAKKQGP